MKDPVPEEALDYLRKKPLDGFELYFSQSSRRGIESKDGKIDFFEASQSSGVAVRILDRCRLSFSYVTSSDISSLLATIEDAIASAAAISPDPRFDLAPALMAPPAHVPIFDDTLMEVPEQTKIEMAMALEEATRSVDPERITKVRKASYQEVLSRRTLINSNGLEFSYGATLASVSVTAVAEHSGQSETGWDFDVSHFLKDLEVERVGLSAGKKALERLGGRRIPSGRYSVLLQNRVASELLSLLAHSFSAEQVQKGKSPLGGKKGQQYFSPALSIVDDGLHLSGTGTSPIDGEGMPSQRTVLVTQGEVIGYLYDRYWANRENSSLDHPRAASTGNSRRSTIKSPPGVGISNFFIVAGNYPFSELLNGLHLGLVVEEVMGLHTVDPISGDFSFGCSGYWVDKGMRSHPVKSIAMAGNLFELFQKVIGVGKDIRFFGEVGSPSLLIEGVEISGA